MRWSINQKRSALRCLSQKPRRLALAGEGGTLHSGHPKATCSAPPEYLPYVVAAPRRKLKVGNVRKKRFLSFRLRSVLRGVLATATAPPSFQGRGSPLCPASPHRRPPHTPICHLGGTCVTRRAVADCSWCVQGTRTSLSDAAVVYLVSPCVITMVVFPGGFAALTSSCASFVH